jgi:hypothetical protein
MAGNEKVNAQTAEPAEDRCDSEEPASYPGGLKLAIITLALCLAVFLVALVSPRINRNKITVHCKFPVRLGLGEITQLKNLL